MIHAIQRTPLRSDGPPHPWPPAVIGKRKAPSPPRQAPFHLLAIAALVLVAFAGCTRRVSSPHPVESYPVLVVPEAGEGMLLLQSPEGATPTEQEVQMPAPRVVLPEDVTPQQIVDVNLDLDELDEQIVVHKIRGDAQDLIHLLVADYDPVRMSYVYSWQGTTQASRPRTFTVAATDLIGDFVPELVCTGTDAMGNHTIDVFRVDTAEQVLTYTPILSRTAALGVSIESTQRSESYFEAEEPGVSFPIVAIEPADDGRTFAQRRETYLWIPQEGRYRLASEQRVEAETIVDEQLRSLLQSAGDNAFQEFLSGMWRSDRGDALLYVDPVDATFALHHEGSQERYRWAVAYRGRSYRRIDVRLLNEHLPTVVRQATIEVLAPDSIVLFFNAEADWTGGYHRLTPDEARSIMPTGSLTSAPPFSLSGVFRGTDGGEIFFSSPRFVRTTPDGTDEGGYALYQLMGETILELELTSDQGLTLAHETYAASLLEQSLDDRTILTLSIRPIILRASRVQLVGTTPIRYEQTIDLASEEESAE